jgi:hypothetical protein
MGKGLPFRVACFLFQAAPELRGTASQKEIQHKARKTTGFPHRQSGKAALQKYNGHFTKR